MKLWNSIMSRKHFKRPKLNGYVFHFSVDYDAIAFDDILDIHKYLMKKNNAI